jgi:hypothetical protein
MSTGMYCVLTFNPSVFSIFYYEPHEEPEVQFQLQFYLSCNSTLQFVQLLSEVELYFS